MVLIRVRYGFLGNYLGISFFIPDPQCTARRAQPTHRKKEAIVARPALYYRRQAPRFNRNRFA